jgi:mono/diheme cytochrome c family protein
MRRPIHLAALALALLGVGIAAGCGSQGVASPTAQTVQGPLPSTSSTTPNLKGNPTAGKAVFTSAGCAGCHTYTPSGSTANVGPNLDNLPTYAAKAGEPLEAFTHGAIVNPPPKYVPPGYPTNVMPTTFGQSLSQQQLADLVAFLTTKA